MISEIVSILGNATELESGQCEISGLLRRKKRPLRGWCGLVGERERKKVRGAIFLTSQARCKTVKLCRKLRQQAESLALAVHPRRAVAVARK